MAPDHYQTMTDEQLAEWAQLSAQVHRLTAELAEEKALRAASDEKALTQYRARIQEVQEAGAELFNARKKLNEQITATRRACAALVVATQAIDSLLKTLTAPNMNTARHYFPGEVFRAMQEAEEVLKAHGIPF